MKLSKKIIGSFLLMAAMVTGGIFVQQSTVLAAPADSVTEGINKVGGDEATKNGQGDLTKLVKNIINTLLYIVGIIAVVAIIIGGVRFITASGDQAAVKSARETILYAVIGLVVAILAFAIVNFVVLNVK